MTTILDGASGVWATPDRSLLIIVIGMAMAHIICGVALIRQRRYARAACIVLQLSQAVQISAAGMMYELFFAPRLSVLVAPSLGVWFSAATGPTVALRYGTSAPLAFGINLVPLLLVVLLVRRSRIQVAVIPTEHSGLDSGQATG